MKFITASVLLIWLIPPSATFAQDGTYIWSDQFENAEEGEWDLESYTDFNSTDFSGGKRYLNQTFELGYSATRSLSFGASQTIGKDISQNELALGHFSAEGLYRFEAPHGFPISPALSLEYSRTWSRSVSSRIEMELILSRTLGPLTTIANGGFEFQPGNKSEVDPEFSGGIGIGFTENFSGAFEMFSTASDSYRLPGLELRGTGVGPTLSFSIDGFSIASGVSFGLTGGADKLNIRTKMVMDL